MELVSSAFKYLSSSNTNLSSDEDEGLCIQLDRQLPVYFAGETVIGRVIVNFTEQKEFKNLSILFEGRAKVYWTESRSRTVGTGDNRRTESYSKAFTAEEHYFRSKVMLLSNTLGGDTVSVPPGTTVYPFSFTLPFSLPTSYNSKIGKVMYSMSARLKKSWYKFDLTSVVPFTVNGIFDLNREIGASQRIVAQKEKYICCWPCRNGPIGLQLTIHRTGFVPGEIIPFTAEMNNLSTRRIKETKVKLIQTVSYHAEGTTKTEENVLLKVNGPTLASGEETIWRELEALRIPPVPPTRLSGCHIIDVQYDIKFEMVASGAATDLTTGSHRILIGTIPLRANFGGLMPIGGTVPQGLPSQPAIIINPPFNPSFPGPQDIPSASPYDKADEAGGDAAPSAPFPSPFGEPAAPSMPPNPPAIPAQPTAAPVPSAPVFQEYPDLPPPSYGDVMGNQTVAGGQHFFRSGNVQSSDDPPPRYDMSSDDNFVPTYVRYGWQAPPSSSVQPPS